MIHRAGDIYLPLIIKEGPAPPGEQPPVAPPLPVEPIETLEAELLYLLKICPDQQRLAMHWSDKLALVAQGRANDMAQRNYFSHTNPDGFGANYLVRQADYNLPEFYGHGDADNNIECIGAGFATGQDCFDALLHSPGHRSALLGELSFYAEQDEIGIGYCYNAAATYHHYWCILIARQE